MNSTEISDNSITGERGGAIYNNSSLTIIDSIISGNAVSATGNLYVGAAAVYNARQGVVEITQALICDNSANYGGAIINIGTTTVVSSTITRNTATNTDAGGILNTGTLNLTNSIVAGNSSRDRNPDIYAYSGMVSGFYNLTSFDAWNEESGNIIWDGSQLFVESEDNEFMPSPYSGAVNAGSNDLTVTETDLAGNQRISHETVDIGAYESPLAPIKRLAAPTILTGTGSYYVSYGTNSHFISWEPVEGALYYNIFVDVRSYSYVIVALAPYTYNVFTDLPYGAEVSYSIKAVGTGYSESDWSTAKTFKVCPMDINGDGDITSGDRALLSSAWLTEEGDDLFLHCCDIDGDGNITSGDRAFLASNWLKEADSSDLIYPQAAQADMIFTEFASADIKAELFFF